MATTSGLFCSSLPVIVGATVTVSVTLCCAVENGAKLRVLRKPKTQPSKRRAQGHTRAIAPGMTHPARNARFGACVYTI